MALSTKRLVIYFILTNSFYNILAITPCDLRKLPLKLQSEDLFSVEEPAGNRPLLQETVSTLVNLSLSINDLNIRDVINMDVEIDLGMTQKWYDHRLAPDYKTRKLAVLGAIWKPKITFVVGSKCPDILAADNYDQTQFWRGTSNGSVFYSERFLVKPKCTKDLTKYPFDAQTCFIKIGSYRFTSEEVSLQWSSTTPIELRVKKELGEFRLEKYNTYDETDVRSAGNFSVLVFEIHISRYSRREVIQSFIPSIILVKIGYGILWTKLSATAIRTRIFTCQFSLLGILVIFINSNCATGVSNSAYFKALDVWFFMCMVFLLLPLVEAVIIHCLDRSEDNFDNELQIEFEPEYEARSVENKKIGLKIDKILRILHPIGLLSSSILFFTVFNHEDDSQN